MVLASWNDVNTRREDIDRNFIVHVWRAENCLQIVLKVPKKIYNNDSNAHLKWVKSSIDDLYVELAFPV